MAKSISLGENLVYNKLLLKLFKAGLIRAERVKSISLVDPGEKFLIINTLNGDSITSPAFFKMIKLSPVIDGSLVLNLLTNQEVNISDYKFPMTILKLV